MENIKIIYWLSVPAGPVKAEACKRDSMPFLGAENFSGILVSPDALGSRR